MFKHVFKLTLRAAIDNCPAGPPSRVGKQLRCPSDLQIYFEQLGPRYFRIACNFADLFFFNVQVCFRKPSSLASRFDNNIRDS